MKTRTAFIFPGQGSQFVGMGKDIAGAYPEAHRVFEEAGEALGFDLERLCFEGPEKELGLTINTQPAILAVSVALWRVVQKAGIQPDFVAGHSLGEYSALVAAEAFSFTDAIKLVRARAHYMQDAVQEGKGAMAAVLGLSEEKITDLFESLHIQKQVFIANLNCPGQIVISGKKEAVELFMNKAQDMGVRCILLGVSVPSHCPLMDTAGTLLEEQLHGVQIDQPKIPVVTNVDAKIITERDDVLPALVRQISSILRWEESMLLLMKKGVEVFVEIGPGRVLSNLLRRINRQVKTLNAQDQAGLQQVLTLLS
ncbi:MAG: ACP S-malonyltransferase [bacterium]